MLESVLDYDASLVVIDLMPECAIEDLEFGLAYCQRQLQSGGERGRSLAEHRERGEFVNLL